MKVRELIVALGAFDPELKVVVDGYEGGFDDPEELEKVKMVTNHNHSWYDGKYDYASVFVKDTDPSVEIAVCIPR